MQPDRVDDVQLPAAGGLDVADRLLGGVLVAIKNDDACALLGEQKRRLAAAIDDSALDALVSVGSARREVSEDGYVLYAFARAEREREFDAPLGLSVMEVAQKNRIDQIEGACGGSMACAT